MSLASHTRGILRNHVQHRLNVCSAELAMTPKISLVAVLLLQ